MLFRIGKETPRRALDKDILEEFRYAVLEEIGAAMPIDIDWKKLEKNLESQLSYLYKQAFKTISNILVGRVHSPNSPEIRNMLSVEDSFGFTRMPSTGSVLTPEGTELRATSRGVLINVGKTIRTRLAGNVGTNLRRDLILNWKPLHQVTTDKKQHHTYFVDTGALQTALRSASIPNNELFKVDIRSNSEVSVKGKKRTVTRDARGRFASRLEARGGKIELASIRVTILPNLAKELPGLSSSNIGDRGGNMDFERAIGIDETSITKLGGKASYHRPLIKPVITYYTLFEAPLALERAIVRAKV